MQASYSSANYCMGSPHHQISSSALGCSDSLRNSRLESTLVELPKAWDGIWTCMARARPAATSPVPSHGFSAPRHSTDSPSPTHRRAQVRKRRSGRAQGSGRAPVFFTEQLEVLRICIMLLLLGGEFPSEKGFHVVEGFSGMLDTVVLPCKGLTSRQ